MKRDKTFVMIGVELFVLLLIVAIVFAKTVIQRLSFIGTLILLEIMCYL